MAHSWPRQSSKLLPALLFLVTLVNPAVGQNSGAVNSTGSSERVGWVTPADNGRGTIGILWSCLSTIFICTWTAMHGNVRSKNKYWVRVSLMVAALLSPEGIAFMSYTEFGNVKTQTRTIQKLKSLPWTTEHSWLVEMKGFKAGQNVPVGESSARALTQDQVSWLAKEGLIDSDRLPSRDDILDKNKTNSLAKFLACIQASWLVLQVLARAIQRLAITTLEIATIAYVSLALITYGFWWKKPQDIDQQLILDCKPFTQEQTEAFMKIGSTKSDNDSKKKSTTASKKEPGNVSEEEMAILRPQVDDSSNNNHNNYDGEDITDTMTAAETSSRPTPIKNDSSSNPTPAPNSDSDSDPEPSTSLLSISALPGWLIAFSFFQFGAIHCAAWNWDVFPSPAEQHWWRVTSVLATVMPFVLFLLTLINDVIAVLAGLVYVIVRVYLIVEPFLGLRSQPVGVYVDVQWVNFIPHI